MRVTITHHKGRCEDCDLRNALDPVGLPKRSKWYGYNLTYNCCGCDGTGVNIIEKSDVTELFSKLTAKQRFVLLSRYSHGLSQTEIAHLMDTSPQAVARIEERAKARLLRKATFREDQHLEVKIEKVWVENK